MASTNQITNIIAAIKTIYPYYAKDTDVTMLVKTWSVLLKDYPDNEVEVAFYKCLQVCKMPPTPADVIEQLKDIKRAAAPTDEELWNTLLKALRQASALVYRFNFSFVQENGLTEGQNARDKFERLWEDLPAQLREFLGGKGELQRLSNATDEELKFERNRFFKTIPTIEKRKEASELRQALESGEKAYLSLPRG